MLVSVPDRAFQGATVAREYLLGHGTDGQVLQREQLMESGDPFARLSPYVVGVDVSDLRWSPALLPLGRKP